MSYSFLLPLSMVDNLKTGMMVGASSVKDIMKFGIDTVVIPIMAIAVLIIMLFYIVGAVKHHHNGESYSNDLVKIGICVVVLALILSFVSWGWIMVGQGGGAA